MVKSTTSIMYHHVIVKKIHCLIQQYRTLWSIDDDMGVSLAGISVFLHTYILIYYDESWKYMYRELLCK